MSIIYQYPQGPPAVVDSLQFAYRVKLPIRRLCPDLPPPFLVDPGASFNCQNCGSEGCFYIPFLVGDVFGFRLNLPDEFNTDPSELLAGWKTTAGDPWYVSASIIEEPGGAILADNIDLFSAAYFVAYSDAGGSFQDFTIDTASDIFEGVSCFSIKLTYRRIISGGAIETAAEIYSEPFKLWDICDGDTAEITAARSSFCTAAGLSGILDNYLGTGPEPSRPFIRVPGGVDWIGSDIEEETTSAGVITKKTKIEKYEIKAGAVAPFFARWICETMIGGERSIDGLTGIRDFAGVTKDNEENSYFLPSLSFARYCNIYTGCK
jgi:hypothetical protein